MRSLRRNFQPYENAKVCDFVGWCALGTAEWVAAIGSVVGGLGAASAAIVSVRIANSVRRAERDRRKAEAITLLRLLTPEVSTLAMKLDSYLHDFRATKDEWAITNSIFTPRVSRKLRNALDQLAEDPLPHATTAVGRLSVLADTNNATIANDVSTLIAHMTEVRNAAKTTTRVIDNNELYTSGKIMLLVRQTELFRDMAAQLANEMQAALGMTRTDYADLFSEYED